MTTLISPTQPTRARTHVAIIGGGFGALMAFIVLRFRGISPDDIRIYADRQNPEATWEKTVQAFRLTHMRSESLGHFFPTDSPGLATVEAWQRRTLLPLLRSWFDAYHPTVAFFLEHTRRLTEQVAYRQVLVPGRISRIRKENNEFQLYGTDGELVGWATNIIIAVGHSQPTLPPIIAKYREKYGRDAQVVHAFEEKTYGPRRVLIIGDGLTSGTEVANALQAGSDVYVLTRYGTFLKQALNSPRRYLSLRGLRPYRALPHQERLRVMRQATQGTIRPYRRWMKLFRRAEQAGRLHYPMGTLVAVDKQKDGRLHCIMRVRDAHVAASQHSLVSLTVDQVIVATGFQPASTHPLLAQLIHDYDISMVGPFIELSDRYHICELSNERSWAAVIGQAAGWALPAADSLGGMKIIAHELADQLLGSETWNSQELAHKLVAWYRLVAGKELV